MARSATGVLAAGIALLSAAGPAAQACAIEPVPLSSTGATLGSLTIGLSGGSLLGGPNGARVWDEPMTLQQSGGTACSVDPRVAIITTPLFDAGGRVLYVTTYSGSHSILFAVDARTCAVLWASEPFRQGPELVEHEFHFAGASAVTIGADCLPVQNRANETRATKGDTQ